MKAFQKTSVTPATLTDALAGIRTSGRAIKNQAQEIIICAFEMYAKSGNADGILRTYKACTQDAGLDKRTMLGFIKAHANVKIVDEGKKNVKFVKSGKGAPHVAPISMWWFNHEPAEKGETPAMNVPKAIDTLITRIERELKAEHVTNMVEAQAALNYLRKCTVGNTQSQTAPEKAVKSA